MLNVSRKSLCGGTRRHNGEADEALDHLVTLVFRQAAIADEPVAGLRLGEARLEDFDFHSQGIARMHRRWPTELVDRPADDAASDLHRFNKESHRDRRRLPATFRQATEQVFANPGIKMKRLWIVAARKFDDFLGRDGLAG